jgi:hypothetical protein
MSVGMMNGLLMGEPVHVTRGPGGSWPSEFTWRGRRHRVRRVESFHWVEAKAVEGKTRVMRIRLRTTGGMRCWLSQDPGRDLWRIERVLDGSGG